MLQNAEAPIILHAIFHGRVQGVCFRATVKQHAATLGLTGTVSNLNDGTVELYAKGKKADLEQLLQNIEGNPGFAHLAKVDVTYLEQVRNFHHFQII